MQSKNEREEMYLNAREIKAYVELNDIAISSQLASTLNQVEEDHKDGNLKKVDANISTIAEFNKVRNQYDINQLYLQTKNYYAVVEAHSSVGIVDMKKKDKFVENFEAFYNPLKKSILGRLDTSKAEIQKTRELLKGYNYNNYTIDENEKPTELSKGEKKNLKNQVLNYGETFNEDLNKLSDYLNVDDIDFVIKVMNVLDYIEGSTINKAIENKNQGFLTIDGRLHTVKNFSNQKDVPYLLTEIKKISNEIKALSEGTNTGGTGYRGFEDTEIFQETFEGNKN